MRFVLIVSLMSLLPLPAFADPCTGGGSGDFQNGTGSAPSPAAKTAIRMVSETVDFIESADGRAWRIKAHYVFANERDRMIPASMIFPFEEPDTYCSAVDMIRDNSSWNGDLGQLQRSMARQEIEGNGFSVRIDGKVIPTTFSLGVTCSGGEDYPFGYFFRHEFEPQKTIMMDVEYTQGSGPTSFTPDWVDCPCHGVDFILETGALWNGTIGEIVLRYKLSHPTAFIAVDRGLHGGHREPGICRIPRFTGGKITVAGIPFESDISCAGNKQTVTLRARDVEPTSNIAFAVHGAELRNAVLGLQGCPLDSKTKRPTRDCCSDLARPIAPDHPRSEDPFHDPLKQVWECFPEPEPPANESADAGSLPDADVSSEAGVVDGGGYVGVDADQDRAKTSSFDGGSVSRDGAPDAESRLLTKEGSLNDRPPPETREPVSPTQTAPNDRSGSSGCGCVAAGSSEQHGLLIGLLAALK